MNISKKIEERDLDLEGATNFRSQIHKELMEKPISGICLKDLVLSGVLSHPVPGPGYWERLLIRRDCALFFFKPYRERQTSHTMSMASRVLQRVMCFTATESDLQSSGRV